jgi:hypothetical protein
MQGKGILYLRNRVYNRNVKPGGKNRRSGIKRSP